MEPKLLFSIAIVAALLVAAASLAVTVAVRRKTPPTGRRTALRPWLISAAVFLLVAVLLGAGRQIYVKHSKSQDMGNPFFTTWETPFGVPPFDRIGAGHFKPAFEEGMRRQRAEIDSIAALDAAPTFDNVILAYDRSGELYGEVSRVFGAITAAETTPELDSIKAWVSPLQAAHSDAIAMNEALFAKVRAVYEARHTAGLDPAQLRLTQRVYQRFVRGGALLDEAGKEELGRINEELSSLGVRFDNNHREAVNSYRLVIGESETSGLPSGVISRARARAAQEKLGEGRLVFTLAKPSLIPLLTYSDNEQFRRAIYEAYLGQCAAGTELDNSGIINDIVRLRTRRAHLLGFSSFADYVLDERMARTPERVYEFLDDIWTPALAKAAEERDDMVELKRSETGDSTAVINSWDWWYYAEKVRKQRYNFDEEQVRPYFALENVRSGIFKLCNRLYGISFRPISAPVYHKDVVVYEVLDIDNSHLGVIYMDFFPRPGKGAGAWCGTYRPQGYTADGVKIAPITNIVCNFTEPSGNLPSLLTLDEVETFFHEFGHAIHNLFADVPYRGLLGTERDFVELPSQIMENWAFQPALLAEYAIQYRSGEPIPVRTVERITQSALFNQGFTTTELVAASFSDMDVHSMEEYAPFDVADFENYALRVKRGLIPEIEPRYRYPYFSHIFDGGYAAGYYGYIWAEVLDKDAFEAFVESGDIFSREVANRFRHKILAQRGMKDGMDLYRDFRGAEPGREALFRARGLAGDDGATVDSLAAGDGTDGLRTRRDAAAGPPSDSMLRVILGEGPLVE